LSLHGSNFVIIEDVVLLIDRVIARPEHYSLNVSEVVTEVVVND